MYILNGIKQLDNICKFCIKDTKDGVEDCFTEEEVKEAFDLGFNISGLKVQGNKVLLSDKVYNEEVTVYIDCLDGDYRGELGRCSDCGELMLIQVGGAVCGECESENLQWYDNNKPEWTIDELKNKGFIIIEI